MTCIEKSTFNMFTITFLATSSQLLKNVQLQ